MRHHATPALALAMMLGVLSMTSGQGEEKLGSSAAGDWNCRIGGDAIGTLSVRASSYVLNRFGASMAGEYQQAQGRIIVSSGPLRGLGVDSGTLLTDVEARTLEFPTASGALLSCREVL